MALSTEKKYIRPMGFFVQNTEMSDFPVLSELELKENALFTKTKKRA